MHLMMPVVQTARLMIRDNMQLWQLNHILINCAVDLHVLVVRIDKGYRPWDYALMHTDQHLYKAAPH